MPVNSFSVGRDLALGIQTPNGPMTFNLITKFSSKPDNTVVKRKGLDGRTRNIIFPDGWSGQFEVERQDNTVDAYFAQWEANYYAGNNNETCTITETITEKDGSVSQYQYTGVNLQLESAGEWAGDTTVPQRITFIAEQRIAS